MKIAIIDDIESNSLALYKIIKYIYNCNIDIDIFDNPKLILKKYNNYDVIFTDNKMNNMSGKELIDFLIRRKYKGKIILVSGYDVPYIDDIDILKKPIGIKDIRKELDNIILN